jgi:simple sugar transport system ATP-binding protein
MHTSPFVELHGITKSFRDVVALDRVDFDLRRGEIHALLGENGAGKTTLMNILSGLYHADAGTIALDGRQLAFHAPRDALRHGIGMVHQHVELVPSFTVLENVLLGQEGSRWWLRRDRQREHVAALAGRYGLAVDPAARVRTLSVGVQQKVEILKALYRGATILILDEPTTMLTPQEVDALFTTIRALTAGGLTVVFITHKIREAVAASTRITVMRRGRVVASVDSNAVSERQLVELMVGQAPVSSPPLRAAVPLAPPILAVQHLTVLGDRQVPALRECSFDVHVGELVGLAGVAGNGQTELGEAIAGIRPVARGSILLEGRSLHTLSVRARLRRGLCVIHDDRIGEGILPQMSLTDTLMLGVHHFVFGHGRYDASRARRYCREAIEAFGIAAPSEDVRTAALSGGNIQKAIAARAFLIATVAHSRVLLAMHPTRGLDVGAIQLLHAKLRRFADAGGGVLLVSEDLDELMKLCDRILVLYRGTIAGGFQRPAFDAYRFGALMTGIASPPAAETPIGERA